jgi:hypothetical protein
MSMMGGVKGVVMRYGGPGGGVARARRLGVGRPEAARIAPAAQSTEEGRALRDARLGSTSPAGAHGVLVADGGERLVEEEEHGQHLAPERAAPHRADGASFAT